MNAIDWAERVRVRLRGSVGRPLDAAIVLERENAARLCEDLADEYLAKGIGWNFDAAVALADRIRSGKRSAPRGMERSDG
jgi:hypothetical protein